MTDSFCCAVKANTGFPGDSVVTNPSADAGVAGDVGLTPGLGRSPGGGSGNPLQDSFWENSTEKPGRLWSVGLQRVGHDSNLVHIHREANTTL